MIFVGLKLKEKQNHFTIKIIFRIWFEIVSLSLAIELPSKSCDSNKMFLMFDFLFALFRWIDGSIGVYFIVPN